jgi:hypothetical protein
MLSSFLAHITSGRSGLQRTQHDKDYDRLGFMQQSMPIALKKALLSMWIAPMLSVAVTVFGSSTPHNTKTALLEEWTDSLEQVLALFLALDIRATPIEGCVPEDLVPKERRFHIAQLLRSWKQGMERTNARMETMAREAVNRESEGRS